MPRPIPINGRKYLVLEDGSRSYFPTRKPLTAKFTIDEKDPADQYARLYGTDVVSTINRLNLPRYGLGNYQRRPRMSHRHKQKRSSCKISPAPESA